MTVLVVVFLELLSVDFHLSLVFFKKLLNMIEHSILINDLVFNIFSGLLSLLLPTFVFVDLLCHLLCQFIVWYKRLDLYFSRLLSNLLSSFLFPEILWILNVKHFTQHYSIRCDESSMKFIFWVDFFNRGWWTFWQLPERFSVFCLCIKWVSVQQLLDVVPVKFVELVSGKKHCFLEIHWFLL